MSGETALARQLKKLAVPQASLPVQDKCRKSFMFDSRDAAALDKDTFFVVGKSGLSKLVQGNPIFAKFESNLFHDIYKDVERSMETANINKKLDEMITDFLRLLSPYFVTTPAHEALEWLVYRFQIHLYNADELVASALPHYSTSSFVLVVQLLNLDDPNSRWAWLLPIKKSGVPLQYSAIVNHFNADGGFKKFVCNLAPNSLKAFNTCQLVATPIVTFSMLTIYTALNVSKTITDNMITFLFPYILKGIKSDFTQYVALSYTIITKIIQNVKLTDVILMDLLVNVFKNDELIKDAFKLLTLIYQQQSLSKMDLEFFKLMISKKECLEELIYISKNYDATLLKAAIIKRAIPFLFGLKLRIPDSVKCKKAFRFCTNFLNSVDLTAEEVSLAFNVICDKYVKFSVESNLNMKLMDETAKVILKSLETNYPEYFDKAVNSYFKKKTKDGKVKKQLCRLINDSICNLKNKIISDIQTSLVLGINHANVHIRKSSAKYLLEQAASGEVSDESFIESSLCDRLSDDSPSVVMEILSSPKVLFDYIEKKKLLDRFDHIFKKKLPEWSKVQMRCLNIMCKYYVDERYLAFEIFSTLLPFIFPLRKNSIKIFYRIMDSKLKSFLPIFQVLVLPDPTTYSEENSEELLKGINFMIISSIKKYVDQLDSSSQSLFLSFLMKKSLNEFNFAIAVIFVIAAGHVIISNDQLNEKLSWLDHLLKFFKSMSNKNIIYDTFSVEMNEEALIEKYVKVLREQQFPGLVFCTTFHKIINFIKLNFCITDKTWLLGEGDIQFTSFKILILLFKFCVEQYNSKRSSANNFKHLLEQFLHSQFSTTENCFNFLSLLWSNAYNVCVPDIQEAAVVSALSFCDNSNSYQWFFDNYQVCICLLKAIADPHTAVRGKSLLLLSSLLQQSKKHNSPLRSLSEYICERSDEITIDSHQCFFVISKYLSFNVCDSQNQSIILDSLLNILKDDKSPNSIKHFILLCLQKMNNVDILTALIPVIDKFLVVVKNIEVSADESHEKENTVRNILQLLLEKFTPESAKCLIENSIETKTFFECLQLVKDNSVEKYDGIQFVLYKQLTKDFFTAIPSVIIQKELLEFLLNVYLSSTSEVSIHIKKILQKLSTYAYLILKDFQKMKCSQKNTTLRDLKRLKLREENLQIFEDEYWKKIIVLLELIQNKSKLEKRKELIPELFNLLNQTMSFDSYASVEYVKQLILSTIHNCCQHLENGELDERQFQVELIVQCIRCSSNPSTHHQSLLLLNLAAKMFPNYVLNNVMSIFTFMGSSLVRQDDSYSFQVISQTIETIVPSLLAASSYQKDNEAIQIVASVIRVFVDSLSDIPQHRQLPLFSKLISTLGSSEYLWIPLAQICDQYATVFHNISDNVSKVSPILEFAVNLHKQFSPSVQIDTCINLMKFLSDLPDNKKTALNASSEKNLTEPFNVATHSDEQLQMYKCNILSYTNIWLSSPAFISQVAELDTKALHNLEKKYEILLESTLHYLQHLRNSKSVDTNEKNTRFNLFPLLFELVGHVNSLLPCSLFIRVVHHLLCNPEVVIQTKAIELLSSKLEQQQELFQDEDHASLKQLLRPLLKVLRKFDSESSEEYSLLNRQTALYALHLLTKVIGSKYPTKFLKVLKVTIEILKHNDNVALTINALLCLAQLCSSLNVEVLPWLNTFMPIIVRFLADYKTLVLNDSLILGIVTTLFSLIKNLDKFLSSYMPSIITGICVLSAQYLEVNKSILFEKLSAFQNLLSSGVDLRILLKSIEESYSQIIAIDHKAVIPLMNILKEKINTCSYTDISACASFIEQYFLVLLDFRNTTDLQDPVSPVELSIISALETFVMKLPVTLFSSFFLKIYQWATATETKIKLRLFTFYGLTRQLSKSLKNLFVVIAKTFLKHSALELDSNNSNKSKDIDFSNNHNMLSHHLINILDALNTCFLYDNRQLIDKDNFEFLMQPLVDQLENLSDDETSYQERVSNYLSSCIARFMAGISDNTLWKKLNKLILLKTRHDSPIVRFAALQVIREVVKVMGDDYLVLLPESIPFLAEILEDESAEVEQECKSVVKEMEKILGEPISTYFR